MTDPPTVIVVCPDCQEPVARAGPDDAMFRVRSRTRAGDRWRPATDWTDPLVCPDCKIKGTADAFDLMAARGVTNRRTVRVPMRPVV